MQVVYSRIRIANTAGRKVKNPRLFSGVDKSATKVYLNGDFPEIRRAYEAAGIPVDDVANMRALPGKAELKVSKGSEE